MLLSKLPQTEHLTVSIYAVHKSGDRLMCPVLGWVSMFLSENPTRDAFLMRFGLSYLLCVFFVALVQGQVRSGGRCLQGTKRANKNKISEAPSLELVHHCFCFKLLTNTSHGAKVIKARG